MQLRVRLFLLDEASRGQRNDANACGTPYKTMANRKTDQLRLQ